MKDLAYIYNLLKNDENQIILVFADGVNATVYFQEKENDSWKTVLKTQGYIGKNGLGKEIEGDLKTPIGLFDIGIAFGLYEINTKLDYYVLNENMFWGDDPNSKYYNKFIELNDNVIKDWEDGKNEHLIDEKIAYEYCLEIKYNFECIPRKGSAIFLHCIKNGPTAGCVSIPKEDLKQILEKLNKKAKIYINAI